MTLEENTSVLLLIDIQEKLFAAIHDRERLKKNVELLVRLCQIMNIPLLVTEQYPKGLGKTIPTLIHLLQKEYFPIEKTTFSCFAHEIFVHKLDTLFNRGRRHLIVCGIETHICVYQTVRDLHRHREWTLHVAADATGARTEFNWRWGLELLREEGASIKPTETLLYELLKEAGTPTFKAMLPFIK